MVNFSSNMEQATKAAERYEAISGARSGRRYKRINLIMDLTAADGENGNDPLDWERLLAADDFNFLHDVGGISRHINRDTGELGNFFVPRFARADGERR
jgi:hypothetical protein